MDPDCGSANAAAQPCRTLIGRMVYCWSMGKETRIVMFLFGSYAQSVFKTIVSSWTQPSWWRKHHKRHEIVFVNHFRVTESQRRDSMCWIKSFAKVVWTARSTPVLRHTFATHLLNHPGWYADRSRIVRPYQLIYDADLCPCHKRHLKTNYRHFIQELKNWRQEERIMKITFFIQQRFVLLKRWQICQWPRWSSNNENKSSWRGRHAKYAESITVKS